MNKCSTKVIYPNLSYAINGILFKVHSSLGRFCKEKEYADLIETVLKEKNITYQREHLINNRNRVDFIIENKIILELKNKQIVTKNDYYQIQRYLQITNIQLGLLINFRSYYLNIKRILNTNYKNL
jgi:GxxExxY protein